MCVVQHLSKIGVSVRFHFDGDVPRHGEILVFGSNVQGIHGAGAALLAKRYYGAIDGIGEGLCGSSYAIPTKELGPRPWLTKRSLEEIQDSVRKFVTFSQLNSHLSFYITGVGCGLAGYIPDEIAPMFRGAVNCNFPHHWHAIIEGSLWV